MTAWGKKNLAGEKMFVESLSLFFLISVGVLLPEQNIEVHQSTVLL